MSNDSPLLTIQQAAEYLGISTRTLRTHKYQRRILAVQVTDRRVGYRKTTLDDYLEQQETNGQ